MNLTQTHRSSQFEIYLLALLRLLVSALHCLPDPLIRLLLKHLCPLSKRRHKHQSKDERSTCAEETVVAHSFPAVLAAGDTAS